MSASAVWEGGRGKGSARSLCPSARRPATVILAVLVIVSLLTLAAYQYSDLMLSEYRAADSAARAQQARAYADSGVYYAAAMLSNPDTMSGVLGNNPYDNASAFQNIPLTSNDARRQGGFSIFAAVDPETAGSGVRYGAVDEASRINPNALLQLDPSGQVAFDVLMRLPDATEEIVDAIIDWIDADDEARTAGAENSHYNSLSPGYACKNGPLDSLEELLLVRGVTPELLFGTDRNRNGIEDEGEDDGDGWNAGWAPYLTIYSREPNTDGQGSARIFLNDADMRASYEALRAAVGETMANYIVLYRTQQTTGAGQQGGNQPQGRAASPQQVQERVASVLQSANQQPRSLSSRLEMVNTSVSWTVGQGRNQQTVTMACPLNDSAQLQQLLPTLLDKTTTQQTSESPACVNVLTASPTVLAALPGNLTEEDVQTIISARPQPGSDTEGRYDTIAWLITDAKLATDKVRALERYVTSRTQVYRVQVVGYFDQPGPMARVEAVIDTNNGRPRIVMYRDLTELGRGLDASAAESP